MTESAVYSALDSARFAIRVFRGACRQCRGHRGPAAVRAFDRSRFADRPLSGRGRCGRAGAGTLRGLPHRHAGVLSRPDQRIRAVGGSSPSVRLCQEADRASLQAIARASFAGSSGTTTPILVWIRSLPPKDTSSGPVQPWPTLRRSCWYPRPMEVCRAFLPPRSSTRKPGRSCSTAWRPNSNAGASTRPCSARSDTLPVGKAPASCWFPPSWQTSPLRKSGPAPASRSTTLCTPSIGGRREWLAVSPRSRPLCYQRRVSSQAAKIPSERRNIAALSPTLWPPSHLCVLGGEWLTR